MAEYFKVYNRRFDETSFANARTTIDDLIDAAFDVGAVLEVPKVLRVVLSLKVRGDDGAGDEWVYAFRIDAHARSGATVSTRMKNNLSPVLTEWEDMVTDSGKYNSVERIYGDISITPDDVDPIVPGALVETLTFPAAAGFKPGAVWLSDEYCAVVYIGSDSKGWLRTFRIKLDGTPSYVDLFQFSVGDAESLVNGGFGSSTAGWTAENSAVLSSEAGGQDGNCLKVLEDGDYWPKAMQEIVTVAGRQYVIEFYHRDIDNTGRHPAWQVYDQSNGADIVELTIETASVENWVRVAYTFVAPSGCTAVRVYFRHSAVLGDGDAYYFDSISVYAPASDVSSHNHIAHVSGDVYAITYDGPGVKMIVRTISISSTGAIRHPIIDVWRYGTTTDRPFAAKVSSTMFALFLGVGNTAGYCFTIAIDTDGNIGSGATDSLMWDSNNTFPNKAVNVTGGMWFVAAHSTSGIDGHTFTIDSSGNISVELDNIRIDTSGRAQHDIIRISSTIVACALTTGGVGAIQTYSIDGNGTISAVDAFAFTDYDIFDPYIQYSNVGNYYAVQYHTAESGEGRNMKIVQIDSAGTISAGGWDALTFADYYYTGDLTYLGAFLSPKGSSYPVFYGGPSPGGYLSVVNMETL